MIWGFMIQLGHNMWGERPLFGEAPKEGREHMFAHDFNRTDIDVWNEVTEYYATKGANLVLIDLGEGIQYPSSGISCVTMTRYVGATGRRASRGRSPSRRSEKAATT